MSLQHSADIISTKTVMIFKDPNPVKRAVTKISWHPDGAGAALVVLRDVGQLAAVSGLRDGGV